ncbi:MAG TPA: LEA type 2 family protein [Spirochaetota bacterium]|nr:LEA type 2 family protein [Spirochaetota bacterium]
MRAKRYIPLIVFTAACLVFLSCSATRDIVTERVVRLPSVRVVSAEIRSLSFTEAKLLFDLMINNPNPIGLTTEGFEYEFLIEGESFLKGKQEGRVQIDANGSSIIPFPLVIEYASIYRAFELLREKDSAEYALNLSLFFDLPLLGRVEVPVRHQGEIPLLKLPRIVPSSLRVERISLSSADLVLSLTVENPNPFEFDVSLFRYELTINSRQWAEGISRDIAVRPKQKSVVEIPLSINFIEIGESIPGLLAGEEIVTYELRGEVNILTPLSLLGEIALPFALSGEIPIFQ